jgi:type I restriction-modification system DNA methylase subunit/restriction endonuclease S subunit
MPIYNCELCGKEFTQKGDFTKHKSKKTPCITMEQIKEIHNKVEVITDKKEMFKTLFKSILNILRDNEGITGERALRNMAYLLVLKMIEPRIGVELDMDTYKYDFSHIEDELVEAHKNKLLEILRFSNLAKQHEDNLPILIKYLWSDILSVHPLTSKIFMKGGHFDIKHQSTYNKIFKTLNSVILGSDYDILGEAYEDVISELMKGKVLGQFFTPLTVKKIMMDLIKPKLFDDGTIETCCDPTMGTGGFLLSVIKNVTAQSKEKRIKINWDNIKASLYGKEIDPDTYQLAMSNMLISTGHIFSELDNGDSIRETISRKFDVVLSNPPFGIKGLKYDEFTQAVKDVLPIKSTNAVSLFIQLIIHILNIGGRCAVVLPDGQDLFSKSNATLVAIREYLMKSCDLSEICYLPAGTFEYTSIKTCIFYFVKKRDNVLKEVTKKKYTFAKTHQTKSVKFYDYNTEKNEKYLLVDVPIEKIIENSYSLNYSEYMKEEEEQYDEGIVVKTLGEVCEIQNGKRIVKDQVETGEYPVLGGGGFTSFYTNEYSREGKTCKISREGMSLHNCVLLLNERYYLNSQAFTVTTINKTIIMNEYLWYYLYNNKEQVFNCGRGTAQKAIDIEEFKSIKIPIPSLAKQQEIVNYLDFIYEKTNKTSQSKIDELKMLNEYCLKNQTSFGANEVKTLGEVCEIQNGKRIVKDQVETGEYPVLGGGGFTSFYTNEYSREGKTCKISREGMSLHNCVLLLNEKYYLNSQAFTVSSINENIIINEYLWHYLYNNKEQVFNCGRGTAQKAIDIQEFKSLTIPIPSLAKQKKIVEYCESNDKLILQLEREIEENKLIAQQFITSFVKADLESETE